MNCTVYNNKCILDVRVFIIIGHVTDNVHNTVQIPVTSHTPAVHTRPMIVIPDQNFDMVPLSLPHFRGPRSVPLQPISSGYDRKPRPASGTRPRRAPVPF